MAERQPGADALVEFRSNIPDGGYRWVSGIDSSGAAGRYLTSLVPEYLTPAERQERHPVTVVHPQEMSDAVFRELGAITEERSDASAEEAILQFANRYGPLWGERSGPITIPDVPGQEFIGESLDAWREAAGELRRVIDIWDAARAGDQDTLSRDFLLEEEEGSGDTRRIAYYRIRGGEDPSEMLGLGVLYDSRSAVSEDSIALAREAIPGSLVSAAVLYIRETVDRKLRYIPLKLAPAHPSGRLDLHIAPASISQFVWVQFAQAIAGGTVHRRCPECRKFIPSATATGGGRKPRSDRTTCSEPCRDRFRRRDRKERAMLLLDAGVPEDDIVSRLTRGGGKEKPPSLRTVRRWIKEAHDGKARG